LTGLSQNRALVIRVQSHFRHPKTSGDISGVVVLPPTEADKVCKQVPLDAWG